jgi:SAM-dependent methyltransferase
MSNETRWAAATGGDGGQDYAARFAQLAASGTDVHGEASLCAALAPVGARVLDAGCGTGRVAIRLAAQGYACVGVDSDASMLAVARETSADVTWLLRDLVDLDEGIGSFDLIVAAGNVIPLLAPGTEQAVLARLAQRLSPEGRLVTGFGLDAVHLPLLEPPFGLIEYDAWCVTVGLRLEQRLGTWGGSAFSGEGYAVNVHRRAAEGYSPTGNEQGHREGSTWGVDT